MSGTETREKTPPARGMIAQTAAEAARPDAQRD